MEDSAAFKIYALEIDGKEPAEGSIIYYNKKDEVGSVTSAIWSPMAKKSIALAQLKLGSSNSKTENLWVEIYSLKELQYHKLMKKVSIVKPPFINLARRSACPPSNCWPLRYEWVCSLDSLSFLQICSFYVYYLKLIRFDRFYDYVVSAHKVVVMIV